MESAKKIRLLIADDSASMRAMIRTFLEGASDILIVGEAEDGLEAVDRAAELGPDVITMDVRMPHLSGVQATRAIMEQSPTRVLMVCDTSVQRDIDISFEAMQAGALEVIPKPRAGQSVAQWGQALCESVRLMASIPVIRRRATRTSRPSLLGRSRKPVSVIGITSSAGGPPALAAILGALPADFRASILIAQHMAPGFAHGLATWLDSVSALRVRIATEGGLMEPGAVYIPPEGCDLVVTTKLRLSTPASTAALVPSGDRLLRSLADALGARAAGVVLSGMGSDGALGLAALRDTGGPTIAQDEATSTVYGMPRVAEESGAARTVLPLESIADHLQMLVNPSPATSGGDPPKPPHGEGGHER